MPTFVINSKILWWCLVYSEAQATKMQDARSTREHFQLSCTQTFFENVYHSLGGLAVKEPAWLLAFSNGLQCSKRCSLSPLLCHQKHSAATHWLQYTKACTSLGFLGLTAKHDDHNWILQTIAIFSFGFDFLNTHENRPI